MIRKYMYIMLLLFSRSVILHRSIRATQNSTKGVKLIDLIVGSGVSGYKNMNMDDFGIGKNILLERLNLQSLPNLKKTIALTECTNLTEFLADGSGITGVILPTGGKIQTAHLPAICFSYC